MYYNYPYYQNGNQYASYPYRGNNYVQQPYYYDRSLSATYPAYNPPNRPQYIRGQATWTEGGPLTQCGIPWSHNQYMTAAVGVDAPYECGETLEVRNLHLPGQRPILVTVVDKVPNFPLDRINLHQTAFQALGAELDAGIINIEFRPIDEPELEEWETYLLGIVETAYPNYSVTNFQSIDKKQISPDKSKETFRVNLQSPEEEVTVEASITYNPMTNRVISFDLKEV